MEPPYAGVAKRRGRIVCLSSGNLRVNESVHVLSIIGRAPECVK